MLHSAFIECVIVHDWCIVEQLSILTKILELNYFYLVWKKYKLTTIQKLISKYDFKTMKATISIVHFFYMLSHSMCDTSLELIFIEIPEFQHITNSVFLQIVSNFATFLSFWFELINIRASQFNTKTKKVCNRENKYDNMRYLCVTEKSNII